MSKLDNNKNQNERSLESLKILKNFVYKHEISRILACIENKMLKLCKSYIYKYGTDEKNTHYGWCGFIGSHVVRLFVNKYSDYKIYNLDKLICRKSREPQGHRGKNYRFVQGDITDANFINELFEEEPFDRVIHIWLQNLM